MKKDKTSEQLKREYEKVYETPLDWCPLFGYLPALEKTHLINKKEAFLIADKCLGFIQTTRLLLGVHDNQMAKYICLPDVKKLISPYNERENESKAIRFLFQNLDYLALKTSPDPMVVDMCRNILVTKQSIPYEPVGRVSNNQNNRFSVLAAIIRVDHHAIEEILLKEAQKITGETIALDLIKLYSLYAILEAWLILTALLFKPTHNTRDLINVIKKIEYAQNLQNIAFSCWNVKDKEVLYQKISKTEISHRNRIANATATKLERRENDKKDVKKIYDDRLHNYSSITDAVDKVYEAIKDRKKPGEQPDMCANKVRGLLIELERERKIILPEKQNRGPKKNNSKT